jgi:hypothetical protein
MPPAMLARATSFLHRVLARGGALLPAKARTRLQDWIAVEIDDDLSFLQTRHSSRQQ